MLNNCTIVITTEWTPNACNCHNEKTANPLKKSIMTFDTQVVKTPLS